jgi:hypothetical protein
MPQTGDRVFGVNRGTAYAEMPGLIAFVVLADFGFKVSG